MEASDINAVCEDRAVRLGKSLCDPIFPCRLRNRDEMIVGRALNLVGDTIAPTPCARWRRKMTVPYLDELWQGTGDEMRPNQPVMMMEEINSLRNDEPSQGRESGQRLTR